MSAPFIRNYISKGERGDRRRGREKGAERVAAVDKIEEKRKPEDFIGHRNRDYPTTPSALFTLMEPAVNKSSLV